MYTTGNESGLDDPDRGEAFSGLLPAEQQEAIRRAEGALDKGQDWTRIQLEAETALTELTVEGEQVG